MKYSVLEMRTRGSKRPGDLPVGIRLVSRGAEMLPSSVSSRAQALNLHVMLSYSSSVNSGGGAHA